MAAEQINFLSAVILVSENAAELAQFYRDCLNIPLEDEQHDDDEPHWGCTLGDIHFAIHSVADFKEHPRSGVGAIKLALTVFDLDSYLAALRERGVSPLYGPKDLGWCRISAITDPDGNLIELTELGDEWFQHLADRRARGLDVVARWKSQS